jgi:colanic acid/amylovoran biosynthesis glycosyltransferase
MTVVNPDAGVRVAMVTWHFPEECEPFVTAEAVGLADRGHFVTMVAEPGDDSLDPEHRFRLGPRLRTRWRPPVELAARMGPDSVRLVGRAMVRDARFTRRVMAGVAANHHDAEGRWEALARTLPFAGLKPEVVYFQWGNMAAQHIDTVDLLGAKVVVVCRGSDVRIHPLGSASLARRMRAVFDRADAVVCVSEDIAWHAERLGLDRSKVVITATGVDTSFFDVAAARRRRAARTDADPFRLVSVGRQHWVKGYEYALDALRLVRSRGHDVRYLIAGKDDGGGGEVDVAVRDLGLTDVVERIGHVSTRRVRDALADADAFLLSSVSEGLCSAALEAMAMGLPVVTTDVGGMAEAVRDGVDGYVVPPREPAAIADAIERLIKDDAGRVVMGERGAARVRERFSSGQHMDVIDGLVRSVAGRRAG